MISVFVYFKTASAAREQVASLCSRNARTCAQAHQCLVGISLRSDEAAAETDTWLEHFRCPTKHSASSLLRSLRDDPCEPALLALIIGGASGRHHEVFEDLPGQAQSPCV